MIKKLEHKTTTKNYFLPNWIDPDAVNPANFKRHDFLKSDKFKILYSGNIGDKQDWEFFIHIAKQFEKDDDVEFIIVGAGSKKQQLLTSIAGLKNTRYHEPVALSELSDLLCSADLHILFQKNNIVDTVMPSKILAMMSSAKPSIVTGNKISELAEIFTRSNGGYFINSDQPKEVIEKINYLKNNPQIASKMGLCAREYITLQFDKNVIMKNLNMKIEELLSNQFSN
jgi:colanic acid biosynthesis glycosyl transferase WcaI